MAESGLGAPAAGNNRVSIVIAPVDLPEHLNRPQIVTRQNGHQVKVDEFNRWAEPLEEHVTAVLAENLSLLLGTEGIIISNRYKQIDADYHLSVQCIRFDGWPGKEAVMDCRWNLGSGDVPTGLYPERFRAVRPLEGGGYTDLVTSMSLMLKDLSREIAKEIKAE